MTTEPRTFDYRVVDLIRAVDGDTYDLTLSKTADYGFRLVEDKRWSLRFRLLGINTPETNEAGGAAATTYAREWIEAAIAADSLRGQTFKTDHFGRWLIDLYRPDDGVHLADALIEAGHGVSYPAH